jgi:hypothetical protein
MDSIAAAPHEFAPHELAAREFARSLLALCLLLSSSAWAAVVETHVDVLQVDALVASPNSYPVHVAQSVTQRSMEGVQSEITDIRSKLQRVSDKHRPKTTGTGEDSLKKDSSAGDSQRIRNSHADGN